MNKRTFLDAIACPTLGWHIEHGYERATSEPDLLRMEEGRRIGERARALFPGGVLVEGTSFDDACETTRLHLGANGAAGLFEAAFRWGGLRARADVLLREQGGWRLLEVKSGMNVSNEYEIDLAYTYLVLSELGVPLIGAELMLISPDYRLAMEDDALFARHDRTESVRKIADELRGVAPAISAACGAEQMPHPRLVRACKTCPLFPEQCLGADLDHPLFELPRLRFERVEELFSAGIRDICELPQDTPLSVAQETIRRCIATGGEWVGPGLEDDLRRVKWPASYLDFETVATAIPLLQDVAPYEMFPFQYSVHVCDAPGVVATHREFLAEPSEDFLPRLAESLLKDLDGDGSVVCYSSYEKRVLNVLAARFPEHAAALQACIERLYDLEAVIRKGYCHPEFRGRTSIKKTLPVLAPDLSYDDLVVGDGNTASMRFASWVRGEIPADEVEGLRSALRAYCERDTEAMVVLHAALAERVSR